MTSFQTAIGVFGGLLMIGALLSGIARRSMLSLVALFVLAGFALGEGGPLSELGRQLLAPLLIEVGDDHVGALGVKASSGGVAEARGTARDGARLSR